MKRVLLMIVSALSVMRDIFLKSAKCVVILLVLAVTTAGCNKTILTNDKNGEEPQTFVVDDAYPTTIYRLSDESLSQIRSDFAQRNPYCTNSVDQFGFIGFTKIVEALDVPSGTLTQEEVIAVVKEFVARNPEETGIRNPDDLHFSNIAHSPEYDQWNLTAPQKEINGLEVYGTEITFRIYNTKVRYSYGNHFPDVYIPKNFNFDIGRAKSILLGKEIVHGGMLGTWSRRVTEDILQKSITKLIVFPYIFFEDGKIELRVAWQIRIDELYYIFHIDVMTGKILFEYPTVNFI